jgi:sodium/proline symporter
VFGFVQDAWSGLAAGFGPALILSLRWKRTSGWGVAAGMLAGVATVLVWRNVGFLSGIIWELLPAFLVSFAVIVAVSLISSPPRKKTLAEFELAAALDVPLKDPEGRKIPLMEFELVRDIIEGKEREE